ncbi:MAG: HAD-IB family hydrolase [Patescibacteria group bacterium]
MSQPFAVFDIDGTIIRWQLYHALGDELARQGKFDKAQYQQVREARMIWKQRTHETSFEDYERALIDAFDEALTSLKVEDLEQACRAVISEYKNQVYTYTRDLITDLKAKNYLLFAISASQEQIVKLVAEHYGFDGYGGSRYEVKDGYFTGKSAILKSEKKPEYLKKLVAKHNADWQGSVAVGDSEGDIPMLSSVEQPIAFNPTRELYEHARANSWPVVVERKNMIYRLEPQDGSYILAQADA